MIRLIEIIKCLFRVPSDNPPRSNKNDEKPMENLEATRKFVEFAFAHAKQEYLDYSDTWKLLDGKAQATATIAGIFVAAIFAFVRNLSMNLSGVEIALLCFGVISLCLSIGFAVRAMVIRDVMLPPTGKHILSESKEMLNSVSSERELEERYVRMLFDTTDSWTDSTEDLAGKVQEKGAVVAYAQWGLLFSIIFFAVLICVTVINAAGSN